MMAQPQPQSPMATTVPRTFFFHHTEEQQSPQTPGSSSMLEEQRAEPSAPPKQTFKVRRRRVDHTQELAPDGFALPTIEMTNAGEESSSSPESSLAPGFLAPQPRHLRLVSPPRTPASQVTTFIHDGSRSGEWSMMRNVRGSRISRPRSACSDFSDSSANSFGSSNTSRSLDGGSCTSPESDAADPFSFYELKRGPPPAQPLPSSTDLPTAKRARTSRHPKWTPEMDSHLWITYMVYVQDPRVTPFKMLPGTAPPLGVCHRVAREAKRSWKGHRTSQGDRLVPRISVQRPHSPDPFRHFASEDRSTPTPTDHRSASSSKWPRSEAATRRRLRDLCKRKPSLSAHYMRLLRTRSPSPFESSSSSPAHQSIPTPDTSAFSSRDMNVSLVAATAPSMQADAPLAQLSREPQIATPAPAVQRPADWFARIGRSHARVQAHQKSQSLQLGLGLNSWSHPENSFERGSILASPFDSDVGRGSCPQNTNSTQSLGRGFPNGRAENGNPLSSPFDLKGPMPTVRSLKRRFGVDEQSTPGPQQSLQTLFAAPPTPASNRPTRNRGFSLSDMSATTPNIASFFTQPSLPDHVMEDAADIRANTTGFLTAPRSHLPPRLGSPFGGSSTNTRFNTFPRHCTAQEPESQPLPFEEKLRQLAAATPQTKN